MFSKDKTLLERIRLAICDDERAVRIAVIDWLFIESNKKENAHKRKCLRNAAYHILDKGGKT